MANKLISIIPSGTNNYLTPAASFNRLTTDLVTPGVVGAFTATTGAFAVTAQGTPNMTVAVAAGNAYVSATPTGGVAQTFGVTQDASENVTIPSNSSGSTVYDFVYIKADAAKLNNPAVNGVDVVTLVTSRSSTAYSASATANGNSNGVQANCLLLAVVTVANNATSITSGNIIDGRVQAGTITTATSIAPGAITLGYAQVTSNVASTGAGPNLITGLSTTVNIPAGGRRIKITAFINQVTTSTAGQNVFMGIYDGSVVSGNRVAGMTAVTAGTGYCVAVVTPAAGTKTYNVGIEGGAGVTLTAVSSSTAPGFILVEAI